MPQRFYKSICCKSVKNFSKSNHAKQRLSILVVKHRILVKCELDHIFYTNRLVRTILLVLHCSYSIAIGYGNSALTTLVLGFNANLGQIGNTEMRYRFFTSCFDGVSLDGDKINYLYLDDKRTRPMGGFWWLVFWQCVYFSMLDHHFSRYPLLSVITVRAQNYASC